MFPEREIALHELDIAGGMNPGPWTGSFTKCRKAAQLIAQSAGMGGEKAFVCGLLHDIGRRTGIAAVRHITKSKMSPASIGGGFHLLFSARVTIPC